MNAFDGKDEKPKKMYGWEYPPNPDKDPIAWSQEYCNFHDDKVALMFWPDMAARTTATAWLHAPEVFAATARRIANRYEALVGKSTADKYRLEINQIVATTDSKPIDWNEID